MPARSRSHAARRPAAASRDADAAAAGAAGAAGAGETSRVSLPVALALGALIVALVALTWSLLFAGGGSRDCQARAGDSVPAERELPGGLTVSATSFFVGNVTITLDGPAADDETGAGVIYTTVTCFGRDGAEALARSRAADAATGSPTSDVEGIGDEGYTIGDGSGLSAIHFRRGDLVAYLVVAGDVTPAELRATAQAFDQAMIDARAGDVPTLAPARTSQPVPESFPAEPPLLPSEPAGGSASPGAVQASPELAALLPTEIDGTRFIVQTFTAADAFGNDAGSRAVTAGLRKLSASPADLELAEVFDVNEELDLYLFAFRLPGADPAALHSLVLDSWLVAGAEGVTTEEVELGGKMVTLVDYGDEFPSAYLYSIGDVAVIIHTGSEDLASAAADALPTSAVQP